MTSTSEVLSAISAISAGRLLPHADSILLSHGNKGNKGNSLTRPMRSHFCYFCYFCGTLLSHAESFYCPDFYCPAVIGFAASLVEEIKEIAEIIVTDPREVLSALSAGHNYLMRIVFCPAVIGFAASLVEEMKGIKEP